MQKYSIDQFLGEGTFSQVYTAIDRETEVLYAVKVLKQRFRTREDVAGLNEVSALQTLHGHRNIIQLHDIIFDRHQAALVLELMGMSLHQYIQKADDVIPDGLIMNWMYQLFEALAFIHKKGLFHRDIKPENILITGTLLKVADLGSCGRISNEKPNTKYISTRWYRPPECILTSGYYTNKMDVWASACVLYELLTRQPLFPGSDAIDQIHLIHKIIGTPDQDLINRMTNLSRDGFQGIVFGKVIGLGFRNRLKRRQPCFARVLDELLAYDPQLRPSANTALKVIFPLHIPMHATDDHKDDEAIFRPEISPIVQEVTKSISPYRQGGLSPGRMRLSKDTLVPITKHPIIREDTELRRVRFSDRTSLVVRDGDCEFGNKPLRRVPRSLSLGAFE